MIFYELTQLYDSLVQKGEISALEWKDDKVHYAIEIDDGGEVVNLLKLGDGKKPRIMKVPYHPSRSSGIKPFFLYDNAEYLLGLDTKGKVSKTKEKKRLLLLSI